MQLDCWKNIYVDDQLIHQFKSDGFFSVKDLDEARYVELVRNQGVIINTSFLGVYDSTKQQIRKLNTKQVSSMTPGNIKDLQLLYDLLWNPDIKVVVVDAIAGSGKTSTTMAFASYMVLNFKTALYNQLILTRPNSEVGRGHGFLPGGIDDKLAPLLAPFYQWLERFNNRAIDDMKESGQLIAQPLAFVRGMDIENSLLVIDETQNMSKNEIKTMLTRVGKNTKVVILGDSSPNQIDVGSLSSENNGLVHVKRNFYGQFDWFGYVELKECLRGEVCAAATKYL